MKKPNPIQQMQLKTNLKGMQTASEQSHELLTYLLNHAKTDEPLTDEAIKQLKQVQRFLKDTNTLFGKLIQQL